MASVSRGHLVRYLCEEMGLRPTVAKDAVRIFFEALADAFAQGNRVEIRGFGSWTVTEKKAHPNARNPRTGDVVFVPARRKIAFRPGKAIREVLSQSVEERRTGT